MTHAKYASVKIESTAVSTNKFSFYQYFSSNSRKKKVEKTKYFSLPGNHKQQTLSRMISK